MKSSKFVSLFEGYGNLICLVITQIPLQLIAVSSRPFILWLTAVLVSLGLVILFLPLKGIGAPWKSFERYLIGCAVVFVAIVVAAAIRFDTIDANSNWVFLFLNVFVFTSIGVLGCYGVLTFLEYRSRNNKSSS